MSAYALSLLTNRQLVIDIQKPCNFLELLEPNAVDWNPWSYDLNGLKNSELTCIDELTCTQRFDNANPSQFEAENDIITIRLNNDWLNYFSRAKHFKKSIKKLGYEPDKFKLVYVMHDWYNKLFRLSPALSRKIDLFKNKSKLTPETVIICAQIRIGGPRPNVPNDSPRNHLSSAKFFWSFIRDNYIADLRADHDWRLFITTDIEVVEKEAIEEFGDQRVIRIPGVFSHVDMEPQAKDCTRVEKPMLDFHFMQNCERAVVSWSGFGKLGAWNRVDPIKDVYVFLGDKWYKGSYNMTV